MKAGNITTPEAFLKAIGRSAETKLTGIESWQQLWQTNGYHMKKAGLSVRDRRYVSTLLAFVLPRKCYYCMLRVLFVLELTRSCDAS